MAQKPPGAPFGRCWARGEGVDFFARISRREHGERFEARIAAPVLDGIQVS